MLSKEKIFIFFIGVLVVSLLVFNQSLRIVSNNKTTTTYEKSKLNTTNKITNIYLEELGTENIKEIKTSQNNTAHVITGCTAITKPGTYILNKDIDEKRKLHACIYINLSFGTNEKTRSPTTNQVILDFQNHKIITDGTNINELIKIENTDNVVVKNLELINGAIGLVVANSKNSRFENITLNNQELLGIYCSKVDSLSFSDIGANSQDVGLYFNSAKNISLLGITVEDAITALLLSDVNDSSIESNIINSSVGLLAKNISNNEINISVRSTNHILYTNNIKNNIFSLLLDNETNNVATFVNSENNNISVSSNNNKSSNAQIVLKFRNSRNNPITYASSVNLTVKNDESSSNNVAIEK